MRIAPFDDQMDAEVINLSSDRGGSRGSRLKQQRSGPPPCRAAVSHCAQDLAYSGCGRNYWAAGSSLAL